MSRRAVRHDQVDRPFVGTPRPLPRVLTCHVPRGLTGHWCGRHWTVNTMERYHEVERLREVHQQLCESLEMRVRGPA